MNYQCRTWSVYTRARAMMKDAFRRRAARGKRRVRHSIWPPVPGCECGGAWLVNQVTLAQGARVLSRSPCSRVDWISVRANSITASPLLPSFLRRNVECYASVYISTDFISATTRLGADADAGTRLRYSNIYRAGSADEFGAGRHRSHACLNE